MAVSITLFDHTVNRFASGANVAADTYIVCLYSALTLNVANTTKAQVDATGTQLSTANGYTQNTKEIACTISVANTKDAVVDFADATWTASGGDIGPAGYAVVFNGTDADDPPVLAVTFGEDKTANTGTDFKITWNASGVISFDYT